MTGFDDRAKRVADGLREYPGALADEMGRALKTSGQDWYGRMLDRFRAPRPTKGNSNRTLHNRSGRLAGSLQWKATRSSKLANVSLSLASRGTPYATTQEHGGDIKPKRAKNLTIPLDAAMTPDGVTRRSARAWFERADGQANERVYVRKTKSGAKLIFLTKGKGKKAKTSALFLLVKKSTIPGPRNGRPSRLGFFKTWQGGDGKRRERFELAQGRAMQRAFGGGE